MPLKAYDDLSAFKVYLADVGLLRALSELPASVVLSPTNTFVEFKGASAENYVLQSLTAQFITPLRYWTSKRDAEVDFLLQDSESIIPIEVKSGTITNSKSLKVFDDLYHPTHRIRYSMKNLSVDGNLINIPLFLCDFTSMLINCLTEKQ